MSDSLERDLTQCLQGEEELRERKYASQVLAGGDFSHLDCVQVVFRGCRLIGVDFSRSFFDRVRWERCDLSGCRFSECSFREAVFLDCRGEGCTFAQSAFSPTRVEEGSWRYANFTKTSWKTGLFQDCRLIQGVFSQVRHRNLAFRRADLTGADFFQTSLRGVDLSTCEIRGLTLSQDHQELRGAVLALEQAPDVAALLGVKWV